MNKILLLILALIVSIGIHAQSDLIISEYIEGSGNNKALEIYNPTKETIDLSKYYVARYSNGSTTFESGGFVQLTGTLESYKTFVLVNGQTTSTETSPAPDEALQALANQLDNPYPAATYMNGNDAIALLKSETGSIDDVVPVDLIGKIGMGSKIKSEKGWAPYTDTTITYSIGDVEYQHTIADYIIKATDDSKAADYGPYWLAWTADHTLRRKFEIFEGVKNNPDVFNISLEWDTVSIAAERNDAVTGELVTYRKYDDIWDDLGKHECIVSDSDFKNSVSVLESPDVQLFPTLVKDQSFTIKSSADLITSVNIINIKGEVVYNNVMTPVNQVTINTTDLAKGMYIVKTTTASKKQQNIRIAVK